MDKSAIHTDKSTAISDRGQGGLGHVSAVYDPEGHVKGAPATVAAGEVVHPELHNGVHLDPANPEGKLDPQDENWGQSGFGSGNLKKLKEKLHIGHH